MGEQQSRLSLGQGLLRGPPSRSGRRLAGEMLKWLSRDLAEERDARKKLATEKARLEARLARQEGLTHAAERKHRQAEGHLAVLRGAGAGHGARAAMRAGGAGAAVPRSGRRSRRQRRRRYADRVHDLQTQLIKAVTDAATRTPSSSSTRACTTCS